MNDREKQLEAALRAVLAYVKVLDCNEHEWNQEHAGQVLQDALDKTEVFADEDPYLTLIDCLD